MLHWLCWKKLMFVQEVIMEDIKAVSVFVYEWIRWLWRQEKETWISVAFGHSTIKKRIFAHKKVFLWALFHIFYSVCPKDMNFRFCYRFISELLGINVDFYELVPNMVIMDKWKQIFCYWTVWMEFYENWRKYCEKHFLRDSTVYMGNFADHAGGCYLSHAL